MKYSYIAICVIFISHLSVFAQSKPEKKTNWYSLIEYDVTTMTHNGEIIITKNPSTYLKKACTISKPNEQIDYYERVASKASFFSVVVEDVAEDENGKVSIVVLKLNYKLGSDEQLKYAEIFFRDKKECLKRREGFKKWLEEDYAKYKARQSKYE